MSAAQAAKAARTPPSSFSVLLRRSKFASYDPKIGQIYATYDGSAARGDWGLKRPLAIRRRNARLAIHNVDTIYQQTEWTSAYTDTEWMRKYDELGVVPRVSRSKWAERFPSEDKQWLHDSDFGGEERVKLNEDYRAHFSPAPNTITMSAKRFERYLRKVRNQRKDFQAFIKAREDVIPDRSVENLIGSSPKARDPLYKIGQMTSKDKFIRLFLAKQLAQESASEDSSIVQAVPHPTGGLTYAKSSDYQNRYRSKPVPGRSLHLLPKKDTTDVLPVNVSVAGWVGKETAIKKDAHFSLTDFGTMEGDPRKDETSGEGIFRPLIVELVTPPEVVGKLPQRVEKAELEMTFVNWKGAEEVVSNPHRPGSREYVAHLNISRRDRGLGGDPVPAPVYRSHRPMLKPTRLPPKPNGKAENLLNALRSTIGKTGTSTSDEDLANS